MARRTVSPSAEAIDNDVFFIEGEIPVGAINGVNKTFTLAYNPNPDSSLEVFVNGQKQKLGLDYSLSGDTLTMTYAWEAGTVIEVNYHRKP